MAKPRNKRPRKKLPSSSSLVRVNGPVPQYVTKGQLAAHDYVSREQLAGLRDELEEWVQRVETVSTEQQRKSYEIQQLIKEAQDTRLIVGNIKRVLFPAPHDPRWASARHGPVSWSYFHVWIARINERLETIEKRLSNGDAV